MSEPGDSSPSPLPADVTTEPEPPPRLAVDIVREDGDWSAFGAVEDVISAAAGALARRLALPAGSEASVVLGSDALVRRLNRAYRGKDAATNVLSFPFQKPPGAQAVLVSYLGDIVLAAETVAREAAEQAIPPRHHVQHLVVHGLLHLLGRDHQTDAEAEAMEQLEIDILRAIGVADPYAAPAAS
jgi:probable rRNA maturation factor